MISMILSINTAHVHTHAHTHTRTHMQGLTASGDVDGDKDSSKMADNSTTLVNIIKKMSKDFEACISNKVRTGSMTCT